MLPPRYLHVPSISADTCLYNMHRSSDASVHIKYKSLIALLSNAYAKSQNTLLQNKSEVIECVPSVIIHSNIKFDAVFQTSETFPEYSKRHHSEMMISL